MTTKVDEYDQLLADALRDVRAIRAHIRTCTRCRRDADGGVWCCREGLRLYREQKDSEHRLKHYERNRRN